PAGVLTPVVRRRRRRTGMKVVLVAAIVAAGAAVLAFHEWPAHHSAAAATPRAPAPAPRKATVSEQPRVVGPLLTGLPHSSGALSPAIAARGAIVVDAGTGAVLWARHPHRRLPIPSTTKIMTPTLPLAPLHAPTPAPAP